MSIEFNSKSEKSRLEVLTADLLLSAKRLGVDACEVAASTSVGLDIQARLGQPEKLEMTRDQSISVTAFIGQSRGSASTTDLSERAIRRTLDAAIAIARVTAPDPAAVLAGPDQIIQEVPDLDLFHPWELTAEEALELAIAVEAAGFAKDSRITNSDGGSVSSVHGVSVHGTTEGLLVSQANSLHGISCVLLAEEGGSRERSYAYTQSRCSELLRSVQSVGQKAAEKTVARLNPRKCETGEIPVLFLPDVASGLLSSFIGAMSGGSVYRKASYLLDRLDTQVMPGWASLGEEPLLKGAMGSSAYDGDGLPTRAQYFVRDGVLNSYILSLYSANRLGLESTHNAGGARNLFFSGKLNLDQLIKNMNRGLIVTELMGQGVNLVNGDYSRGASGFWVENGEIAYPVHEVTVASNLDRMMKDDLVAVGSDLETCRSVASGSMLFERMMVAGS
ncbi:metalloprotease PmbA [Litorivicinus sp.]|nr:metalloprotease PmbA [Litorivicinus sp.]